MTEDDDAIQEALEEMELATLVWASPHVKHSGYKNAHGRIHMLSPWRLVNDWSWTRARDPGDFDFSREGGGFDEQGAIPGR